MTRECESGLIIWRPKYKQTQLRFWVLEPNRPINAGSCRSFCSQTFESQFSKYTV